MFKFNWAGRECIGTFAWVNSIYVYQFMVGDKSNRMWDADPAAALDRLGVDTTEMDHNGPIWIERPGIQRAFGDHFYGDLIDEFELLGDDEIPEYWLLGDV